MIAITGRAQLVLGGTIRLTATMRILLAALATLALLVCAGCTPTTDRPARSTPGRSCVDSGIAHSFITRVSKNGRYFVDQHGKPILVQGDSPWSGLTDWSPDQAELYFANRQSRGFNAAIISLIGAKANGGPADDGSTFDRLKPFIDGDITRWNEAYWSRIDDYIDAACRNGITLFLYFADGWNYDKSEFDRATPEQLIAYGRMVAERFQKYPNIMWMAGGDYSPQMVPGEPALPSDLLFDNVLKGIRESGDRRPFSIQTFNHSFSTESPFWASRVDWNFVYAYHPTYEETLKAYRTLGPDGRPLPAVFSEGNYENENNLDDADTTDETLRRQALWALTSGSPGDFRGSDDWEFHRGWEDRLDTVAVQQLQEIRAYVSRLEWWKMAPDDLTPLVVDGRGTRLTEYRTIDVLDNDFVTACGTRDTGYLIYIPTARSVQIDTSKVPAKATLEWVDPTDALGPHLSARLDTSGKIATPGTNSAGSEDWLLRITPSGSPAQ